MAEVGNISEEQAENLPPDYWKEVGEGAYTFDYSAWQRKFLSLPPGTGGNFRNITQPAIDDGDILEIIKRASMVTANEASGGWDDLTGKTKSQVLGEKIYSIFQDGKSAVIDSCAHLSLSERRVKVKALEAAATILKQLAKSNDKDPSLYDLTADDKVRFIVAGRMGHGCAAESVYGILAEGLRVDTKRNTSKIPVLPEAEENLRQFSMYDPLTFNKGEMAVALVYGETDQMDDSLTMTSRNYELAVTKGEIAVGPSGGYVFTAAPELVICKTPPAKERILDGLSADLRSKWESKIVTQDELISGRASV